MSSGSAPHPTHNNRKSVRLVKSIDNRPRLEGNRTLKGARLQQNGLSCSITENPHNDNKCDAIAYVTFNIEGGQPRYKKYSVSNMLKDQRAVVNRGKREDGALFKVEG